METSAIDPNPGGDKGQPDSVHRSEVRRMQAACDAARSLLEGEGIDAAVVIATWQTENGQTATVAANSGNWYAQNGMMHELLQKRKVYTEVEELKRLDDAG